MLRKDKRIKELLARVELLEARAELLETRVKGIEEGFNAVNDAFGSAMERFDPENKKGKDKEADGAINYAPEHDFAGAFGS